MRRGLLNQFLRIESSSGIILFATTFISMVWANSSLSYIHQQFIDASLFWINAGVMTIFALSSGLLVVLVLRWVKLPKNTSWLQLYGISILCGIGFTMSLFLGTLSFQNANIYLAEVRLGVIIGTMLSGLVEAAMLSIAFARNQK